MGDSLSGLFHDLQRVAAARPGRRDTLKVMGRPLCWRHRLGQLHRGGWRHGTRLIPPVAAWWLNGDDLLKVQIGFRLQGFAGGAATRRFRQCFEPIRILRLQRHKFGDRGVPALRPRGGVRGWTVRGAPGLAAPARRRR